MTQSTIKSFLIAGFFTLVLYIAYYLLSGIITEVNNQSLQTEATRNEILK